MNKSRTALYRYYGKNQTLLYVGISLSAVHRLKQHSSKASWVDEIENITIEYFPTRAIALKEEKNAIKLESPIHNIIHNDFSINDWLAVNKTSMDTIEIQELLDKCKISAPTKINSTQRLELLLKLAGSNKAKILLQLIKLKTNEGYVHTTMREIALNAGVGTSEVTKLFNELYSQNLVKKIQNGKYLIHF